MTDQHTVTQLLQNWKSGNADAMDKLTPLLYDTLKQMAGKYMRQENAGHTLQATALVNEAYLQLYDSDQGWANRAHFLGVAARIMRHVLIDHARANKRNKRGGDATHVTLIESRLFGGGAEPDLLALDEVLGKLEEFDERKARVIELSFFGGLTYDEIAEVLTISPATVDRELRIGKAWLCKELRPELSD